MHMEPQPSRPAIDWVTAVRWAQLAPLSHGQLASFYPGSLPLPTPASVPVRCPRRESASDQFCSSPAPAASAPKMLPSRGGHALHLPSRPSNRENGSRPGSSLSWESVPGQQASVLRRSCPYLLSFSGKVSFFFNLSLSWHSWGPTDPLITLLMPKLGIN